MGALASLFGQIAGAFGRPYLVTGLLPAAVLAWAWSLYRGGWGAVGSAVRTLFAERPGQVAGSALETLLAWLAIGLAFFASRELVLSLARALPGRVLGPLREWLIGRQMKKRAAMEAQQRFVLEQYTALRWYRHGFAKAKHVPLEARDECVATVAQASATARKAVEEAVQRAGTGEVLPTHDEAEVIARGLTALHAASGRGKWDTGCDKEVARWKETVADTGVAGAVDAVGREVLRRWFALHAALHVLPQPIWMRPTALGNRAASLDDYGERNYGLDTSTMWSRLAGLVPAVERQAVNSALLTVEALLNIGAASFLFVVGVLAVEVGGSIPYVLRHGYAPPDWRGLAFIAGGVIAAILAYRAAVYAFGAVADRVVGLVDLYRLKLLEQLGFGIPATVGEELALFRQLRGFFAQASVLDPALKLVKP